MMLLKKQMINLIYRYRISNIVFCIVVLFTLFNALTPVAHSATNNIGYGLVRCDGVINGNEPNREIPCNFAALVSNINYIISWLFYISIPIATALFAYAGFLYITGKQDNIGQAKKIFTNVGVGFIIMLVAWFAVYTFVNWFVAEPAATSLIGNP